MSSEVFQKINELQKRGERIALATLVRTEGSTPRGPGARMIVLESGETFGTVGGDRAEEVVKDRALDVLKEGDSEFVEMKLEEKKEGGVGMKCGGEVKVFIDILEPSLKLILIGSGKVAVAVAELAMKLGFRIIVIDPYGGESDFPDSVKFFSKSVEEGMKEVEVTPQSYIVIMTRHEYDEAALLESLDTNAGYIGMMGSENRVRSIFEDLEKEKGLEKEELSRIHAPVGLDIGAETPREIAISILAEIIREIRNPESSGGSLKINY